MKMALLLQGSLNYKRMTNAQKRSLPRPTPSHSPFLVAASSGIRREVSQKFSPQGGCTRGHGRRRRGAGRVVYCSPKCFYLALRRPRLQLGKETLELGSFAIASDISFVLLSFIIILPLSLLTRFFSFFVFFFLLALLLLLLFFYFGPS